MFEHSLESFTSLEASVDFLDTNGSTNNIYSVRKSNLFSPAITTKVFLFRHFFQKRFLCNQINWEKAIYVSVRFCSLQLQISCSNGFEIDDEKFFESPQHVQVECCIFFGFYLSGANISTFCTTLRFIYQKKKTIKCKILFVNFRGCILHSFVGNLFQGYIDHIKLVQSKTAESHFMKQNRITLS